ncbi:Sister chromatid cohesion 1 protein 1, partial [Mucuna pruriens]
MRNENRNHFHTRSLVKDGRDFARKDKPKKAGQAQHHQDLVTVAYLYPYFSYSVDEEILNPSIPMALRLSGILMGMNVVYLHASCLMAVAFLSGGVVIVYERKVKLLYEDVTHFLVEINEAWKVKTAPDPTLLPKGKSKAKKEAVTLPGTGEINVADTEQSLQFSNTGTTMGFQHNAYFTMRLDSVDEPFICNGAREDEDPSVLLHQADAENITLFERFETFQANAETYNHFERFDIEGDEETQVNANSGDQIPTMLVPSPPHQDEPTRGADTFQDHHPGHPVIQQPNEGMIPRQVP